MIQTHFHYSTLAVFTFYPNTCLPPVLQFCKTKTNLNYSSHKTTWLLTSMSFSPNYNSLKNINCFVLNNKFWLNRYFI